MTKQSKSASSWQQQNISNTKVLMGWTFAWLCSMALVKYAPMFLDAPGFLEDKASFLHLIFIIINILVGAMMIWANKNHLAGLDELQRQIQLQAMGITLGVGLVLGMAYVNLAQHNYLTGHAEISHLVMLMALVYLLAVFLGVRKYQ